MAKLNIQDGISKTIKDAIRKAIEEEDEKKLYELNIKALREALIKADGFIGLSASGALLGQEEWLLKGMKKGSFIFALANPVPEFDIENIIKLRESSLTNIAVVVQILFITLGINSRRWNGI